MPLNVEGIDPVQLVWLPANLGIASRWEVTCGRCRKRFRRVLWELMIGSKMSWVGCSHCGARKLLPHHPNVGPRDR